jgi:hypothetical protein
LEILPDDGSAVSVYLRHIGRGEPSAAARGLGEGA